MPTKRSDSYYGEDYYAWQKKAGEYGAEQDTWMYTPFIKKSATVLDFGCGGGYILERINCKEKYGVDINPVARQEAKKRGVTVFSSLEKIPVKTKFDVIMSHHTLEHVDNPAEILQQLRKRLKPKGKLVLVVPIDDWRRQKKYNPGDINQHLYTWSPQLLGNLLVKAGFTIEDLKVLSFAWVPLSRYYFQYIPKPLYFLFSQLWSRLILSRQIRIVGTVKN